MTLERPFYEFIKRNPPDVLIGRDDVIRTLLRGITNRIPGSFQISCFRGVGKSAVLRYLDAHATQAFPQAVQPPFDAPDRLIIIYIDCVYVPENALTPLLLDSVLAEPRLARYRPDPLPQTPTLQTVYTIFKQAAEDQRRVVVLLNHFDDLFKEMRFQEANKLRPLARHASFVIATEEPLVDLNPSAYASWFGAVTIDINLDPLSYEDGRKLIRLVLAEAYGQTKKAAEIDELVNEYGRMLFKLTGLHPPLILRGADEYWNIKASLPSAPEKLLKEVTKERLYSTTFQPDFKRYWRILKEPYRKALIDLVSEEKSALSQELGLLQQLRYLGLVVWSEHEQWFEPYSYLWCKFLLKQTQPDTAEPDPSSPPDNKVELEDAYTPRQLELRDYFVNRPNTVCTYEDILRTVWQKTGDIDDGDQRLLRETIRQLRPKLKEQNEGSIKTHRGRGYEFRPTSQ